MASHAEAAFSRKLVTSPRAIILIAWLNIFLLTTEITLGLFYIIYNRINRRTKWTILSSLFIDLTCVITLCTEVINIVTLGRKNEWAYNWHTAIIMILSQVSALVGQAAFFRKYGKQSPQSRIMVILAISLLTARMASCIVSNASALAGTFKPSPTLFVVANVFALVLAILLAFTDLWIVYLLMWKRPKQTKFLAYGNWQRFVYVPLKTYLGESRTLSSVSPDRKVEQATLYVFSHGIINALSSNLRLILWFIEFTGFRSIGHVMGRVYTLSLIVTLIADKVGQEQTNGSVSARNTPSHIRTHVTGTFQLSTIYTEGPSREEIAGESNIDLADSHKDASVDFSDLGVAGSATKS
ncbi:hypothetical protein PQX77_016483 [Marasmius sp. AFHP31]|nr:hypothetical protein PQX77_016483 [Marasmius sp. AFHP31]